MKRAKISELKARLSEYLAGVRAGDPVIVCDRSIPVARLVPFSEEPLDDIQVEEPTAPLASLRKIQPIRLRRRVDVIRLLRESRDQR